MVEKRINWTRTQENTCEAFNQGGEYLGSLEYENVGAHIHWCWYQEEDIRMSPGCLEEVRVKQKELFKEKRK